MNNVRFSRTEQRLYEKLISLKPTKKNSITTKQLVRQFYGKDIPDNAQPRMVSLLRKLELITMRQKPSVKCSERRGPHPLEVWLD